MEAHPWGNDTGPSLPSSGCGPHTHGFASLASLAEHASPLLKSYDSELCPGASPGPSHLHCTL